MGGGSGFNPEMTPTEITVSSNGDVSVPGQSLLTIPEGANYNINLVKFEIPSFAEQTVELSFTSNDQSTVMVNSTTFVNCATWFQAESEWRKGLQMQIASTDFGQIMANYGTSDGAGGYTATGTATVTITDLTNGVSAVKEITVNFTYQQG